LWGANVFYSALGAVIAGVVTLIGFWWMINKTRLGIGMQATSSNQETALALGIPVGRIFGSTWFIAGAVAALAGIFLSMFPRNLDSNLGFVALRAFPAVIVGGLDSIRGAVVAGLGLGLLEVLAQGYVNEHLGQFGHNFHTVFPYLVMVLFLVFKPHGLFGTKEVERV
jgi:branched-chain amino acid transport system permease protein